MLRKYFSPSASATRNEMSITKSVLIVSSAQVAVILMLWGELGPLSLRLIILSTTLLILLSSLRSILSSLNTRRRLLSEVELDLKNMVLKLEGVNEIYSGGDSELVSRSLMTRISTLMSVAIHLELCDKRLIDIDITSVPVLDSLIDSLNRKTEATTITSEVEQKSVIELIVNLTELQKSVDVLKEREYR